MLASIPASEETSDIERIDLSFDELPLERTLGLQWEREFDHFRFKIHLKNLPATRRDVLSIVASIRPYSLCAVEWKSDSARSV